MVIGSRYVRVTAALMEVCALRVFLLNFVTVEAIQFKFCAHIDYHSLSPCFYFTNRPV